MKPCPHCGKPVQVWRLFNSSTHYHCPACSGVSKIDLWRQSLCVLAGPLAAMALAVFILIHFAVQSWYERILIIAPIVFLGALFRDILNASFGKFHPVKSGPK